MAIIKKLYKMSIPSRQKSKTLATTPLPHDSQCIKALGASLKERPSDGNTRPPRLRNDDAVRGAGKPEDGGQRRYAFRVLPHGLTAKSFLRWLLRTQNVLLAMSMEPSRRYASPHCSGPSSLSTAKATPGFSPSMSRTFSSSHSMTALAVR